MKLFGKTRIKKLAIPNILLVLLGFGMLSYSYFRGIDNYNNFSYLGWFIIEIAIFLGLLEQYLLKKISKKVFYVFGGLILLTIILMIRVLYIIL